MDVLPLPPRPSLDQYRKRAKDLVKASRSSDADAVRQWASAWIEALATLHDEPVTPFVQGSIDRVAAEIERRVREHRTSRDEPFGLSDAQFLIARAHGFASWAAFTAHLDGRAFGGSEAREFETAADAVVRTSARAAMNGSATRRCMDRTLGRWHAMGQTQTIAGWIRSGMLRRQLAEDQGGRSLQRLTLPFPLACHLQLHW